MRKLLTAITLCIITITDGAQVFLDYATIEDIEKNDRKGYDVDLGNGIELEFDKRFRVVDMD